MNHDQTTPEPLRPDEPPIPVLRPRLPDWRQIAAYLRVMDETGWYSNFGPLERQLRHRLAARLGCDETHVVTASSGTAALTGLVAVSDLPGWEIPAFTFPAAGQAVIQASRSLELVDIAADSLRIGDRPRRPGWGRIEVLPFGLGIAPELLRQDGPDLVIDAAASLGATNAPLSLLRPGDAVVFSLHATKVLGCGEGGIAVCGSEDLARRLRAWTNFGFQGSREAAVPATNAKLSEYACAVSLAALDDWPATLAAWQEAQTGIRAVTAAAGVPTLPPDPPEVSPYCIAMFPDTQTAERVVNTFAARGLATRRWWARGLHRMPAFAAFAERTFPMTDAIAGRSLGLPVYPGIDQPSLERIAAALAASRIDAIR